MLGAKQNNILPSRPALHTPLQDASLGFLKQHCARGLSRYEIHDNSIRTDFLLSTGKIFTPTNFQLQNNAIRAIITVLV